MSKFTGEGFSSEDFAEDERRQMRERQKHYDEHIAPHASIFAILAVVKGRLFWVASGAAAFAAYAVQNGWIG